MRLAFLNTNTPSNVGNGFFYFGLQHVLEQASSEIELITVPFPPHNPLGLKEGHTENAFFLERAITENDGIVIAGPVLDRDFENQFGELLRKTRAAGKKIFMFSIGSRRYDAEEKSICEKLLSDVRPDIFVSRDSETFELYGKTSDRSRDGMCFAFYVADAYKRYKLGIDKRYCVAAFDFDKEHKLSEYIDLDETGPKSIKPYPKTGTKSFKNKASMVLQRSFSDSVGELEIIRPTHRPIRKANTVFHKPNSFSDYDYLSYLHLYANTEFTITDRLHAAVATMAFGKPAYLPLLSNRSKLLKSAGCEDVLDGFFVPDASDLERRKSEQFLWVSKQFSQILCV